MYLIKNVYEPEYLNVESSFLINKLLIDRKWKKSFLFEKIIRKSHLEFFL